MTRIHVKNLAIVIVLLLLIQSCKTSFLHSDKVDYVVSQNMIADSAMIVSAHPLATKVGLQILKNGGNAYDATIAVQFALAVVYPRAGNIGGGGFMVIRENNGNRACIDYREKAPMAASRDMYLDENGDVIPDKSLKGHLASGVPGSVAGLYEVHKKYGSVSWESLVQPALKLAKNGFRILKSEAERLNRFKNAFLESNTIMPVFVKSKMWKEGDLLVQKDLSNTLSLIMEKGSRGFYEGETADKIVKEMTAGGGIITHEDLAQYQPVWRKPVESNYKGFQIISMPPSSSGGVALCQLLEMVEPFPLSSWGSNSAKSIHLMAEAMRRVYADRAEYLGDSDFYTVPLNQLLDTTYIDARMSSFKQNKAGKSNSIFAGDFKLRKESFETTHTSVVDSEGNAVSVTTTINYNYGNKVVVGNAGFLLNNEMDDFSAKPGVPNGFGLVGNEANAIAPNKRMLSSMTPTIIEKDGELFMVLGTPGGSTIITAVFQTFINVVEFGFDLQKAIANPRFHHQWLPDQIMFERNGFEMGVLAKLGKMGHKLSPRGNIAKVKAIQVLPNGKLHGVGDPRVLEDHAEGY